MDSKEYFEHAYESHCEELRAQVAEADLIYIDSCSLMDPYMPLLAEHIIPILEVQRKKLIVIENVLSELKHLMRPSNNHHNLSREIYAYMGLYSLRAFAGGDDARGFGILEYQYVPDEIKCGHADAAFEAVLGMKSIANRIMVITQDKSLAEAVLRLNDSGATLRKPIKVYKISHTDAPGFLASIKKMRPELKQRPPRIQTRPVKPKMQQSVQSTQVKPQYGPQSMPAAKPTRAAVEPSSRPQPPTMRNTTKLPPLPVSDQLKTADALRFLRDTELHVPASYSAISRVQIPEMTAAYLPETIKSLMPQAFIDCSKLTRVALPNSLETIEESAFQRCISLHSVTIPKNVKRIDSAAFKDCSTLSAIALGSGLEELGSSVFANCIALTDITIPSGVKRIETMAFKGCRSLSTLNLSEGLESIAASAFSNCTALLSLTIPRSVNQIATTAFAACPSLTLYCYRDSYAHRFAIEQRIKHRVI